MLSLRKYASFKPEYFARIAGIEKNNFWFCSRRRLVLWGIKKYFSKADNFFEIGCGTGFLLSAIEKEFPCLSLYGSDIYSEGLEVAKNNLQKATLLQMDARAVTFKDKFDLIGAFDILEHIEEDRLVLAQIHQALRAKGGLILTVPQHKFLWSGFDDTACHLRRYNRDELVMKLQGAGFRVIRVTSFVSLLFPFMLISRFMGKKKKVEGEDALKVLEFNPVINKLLEKVLDFERFLISLGISFPFGGSLFLIATKKIRIL